MNPFDYATEKADVNNFHPLLVLLFLLFLYLLIAFLAIFPNLLSFLFLRANLEISTWGGAYLDNVQGRSFCFLSSKLDGDASSILRKTEVTGLELAVIG